MSLPSSLCIAAASLRRRNQRQKRPRTSDCTPGPGKAPSHRSFAWSRRNHPPRRTGLKTPMSSVGWGRAPYLPGPGSESTGESQNKTPDPLASKPHTPQPPLQIDGLLLPDAEEKHHRKLQKDEQHPKLEQKLQILNTQTSQGHQWRRSRRHQGGGRPGVPYSDAKPPPPPRRLHLDTNTYST